MIDSTNENPLWPRITSALRQQPGLWLVPLVLGLSLGLSPGEMDSGPVLCPFRTATGMPCAGCGVTRAFVAISHGHFLHAVQYNLFSPFWFFGSIAWWLRTVHGRWVGKAVPDLPRWLLGLMFAVLSGYWLVRDAWFLWQPDVLPRIADQSPLWHWLLR